MSDNNSTQPRKILLLSANPRGTSQLRLDEEMREIKAGLRRAKKRDLYLIERAEAVRYRDIHRAILDYEPHIIHFSGHGTGEEGLAFEDEMGQVKLVDAEALAGLFQLFADQLECVVLNACYSKYQAQEIAQHINYVVGMSQAIQDKAAIEFAVGFYDALGAGRNYEFAYKLGCNVILMAGIAQNFTPQLLKKDSPAEESPCQGDPVNTPAVENVLVEVPEATPAITPESDPIEEDTGTRGQEDTGTKESMNMSSSLSMSQALCVTVSGAKQLVTSPSVHLNDKQDKQENDYIRLRDLLKFGQWKEADEETAAVMQRIAAGEKQVWVDDAIIQNFPCVELNTINRLWLEYSRDRFGLSVQQEIFANVNYNWDEFGDRVGWCGRSRKGWFRHSEIYWKTYAQLTFTDTAPVGHLPVLIVWEWRENLLSRIQACQQESGVKN
ncbi:GUN4 domain-containing protein [Scytonema sp. PCC 10023]|uniref:GUN4 domain-containing protein n=1 Tax=Scytonema sp. PCC 10023 TaxID=1680591 RepID=UPI0039C6D247